jgi:hypothetical protein
VLQLSFHRKNPQKKIPQNLPINQIDSMMMRALDSLLLAKCDIKEAHGVSFGCLNE